MNAGNYLKTHWMQPQPQPVLHTAGNSRACRCRRRRLRAECWTLLPKLFFVDRRGLQRGGQVPEVGTWAVLMEPAGFSLQKEQADAHKPSRLRRVAARTAETVVGTATYGCTRAGTKHGTGRGTGTGIGTAARRGGTGWAPAMRQLLLLQGRQDGTQGRLLLL
jgi:hypothetical protein